MIVYVTIWVFVLSAGIAATTALIWSFQVGHMQRIDAQAVSIFDAHDYRKRTLGGVKLSLRGD